MKSEVVRIGVGSAQITKVTPQQVEYLDDSGAPQSIDLQACADNWVRQFAERRDDVVVITEASAEDIANWNARCVGMRAALSEPPQVVFMTEQRTRFEFRHYDEIYALLLMPLMQAGWHTFDGD